jgi:hypothetical protein
MAISEATRPAFSVQDTPALSNWHLAISQTNINPNSKPPCLRVSVWKSDWRPPMKTSPRKNRERKKPRSGTKPAGRIAGNGPVEFPEAQGKTIEELKLFLASDEASVCLSFSDKTYLQFDFEPGVTVRTDYSDWTTHNWRPIKRWPPLHSPSSWAREPGKPGAKR